tara:strand:- start:648 stop:2384 length:1737 start_codon:yes stop_codon:yes gene_type:complete
MKLKSFKIFFGFLTIFIFLPLLNAEEKIDIWKNDKTDNLPAENDKKLDNSKNTNSINKLNIEIQKDFRIEENTLKPDENIKVYGIYDPADFDFNLNMWSTTKAEDVLASLKRIKKIKLSRTSNEILENILLSFSYPPKGMDNKDFVNLRINWLIENDRSDLIENFLKQNNEFDNKSKAVQYLVNQKISQANIKEGCENISFIDSSIKDSYLEKFKIYCLVFNNKNSQAQLLLDLLREQKQSDKFFDDKINYLLGISDKTSNKINEKNLLNFYLSSITVKDFKYTPSKKTKKEIWRYLNAANLIKLDDVKNKQKLKELEIAANQGQVDPELIFSFYKQIEFNLNTLVNAKNLFQTLDETDARSLIYQKYLLSEEEKTKINYLFLLEDLFKKSNLQSIYSKFLSDELMKIGLDNIPENFKEIAKQRIVKSEEQKIGKIKYNDKVLHQSKIMKYYLENEEAKKIQKDIDKIFKRISKNRKYFYSAKDLALADALIKDGFKLPSNFNQKELVSRYEVPKNLLQLIEKKQNAFLALRIVEIIGEDEPYQLDSETIYFITNLLNEMNLIQIRNKILISALPQRV